jgi:hypothetical protein
MVPSHRGQKAGGAELTIYDKTGHNVLTGVRIDPYYKKKPKTEAEKHFAETVAGFTSVVDKQHRKSGFRLKIGIDRQGNLSFNIIDRHGFGFLSLDKYESENLVALMLLHSGILDGRYRRKKGHRTPPNRGLNSINIGKITHEKLRSRGVIYCPSKYWGMAEMIAYKFMDTKQRRLNMIRKRFSLAGWVKNNQGID